jgi:hypothetical protein
MLHDKAYLIGSPTSKLSTSKQWSIAPRDGAMIH